MEVANRAIRSYPDFPLAYRWLAAALGQLGRTEEARKALEEAIAISPTSFDMYVRDRVLWMGQKTTLTCSKGCERPDGRVEPPVSLTPTPITTLCLTLSCSRSRAPAAVNRTYLSKLENGASYPRLKVITQPSPALEV